MAHKRHIMNFKDRITPISDKVARRLFVDTRRRPPRRRLGRSILNAMISTTKPGTERVLEGPSSNLDSHPVNEKASKRSRERQLLMGKDEEGTAQFERNSRPRIQVQTTTHTRQSRHRAQRELSAGTFSRESPIVGKRGRSIAGTHWVAAIVVVNAVVRSARR